MVKWLVTLTEAKFIRASLVIVVVVLFGLFMDTKKDLDRAKSDLLIEVSSNRKEQIHRTDSFNLVKEKIIQDCNATLRQWLEDELSKFQKTNKEASTTISKNAKLIKRLKDAK